MRFFVLIIHTKNMTNTTATIEDLEYAIAKATENIAKAVELMRFDLAQQMRRDRKRIIEKRDALVAN